MNDVNGAPIKAIAMSLRKHRETSGKSLTEVARNAGVAKSTLSQLEAGTGNPNIETLWALAVALEVPLGELLDPPRQPVHLIRAGEGDQIGSEESDYAVTLLSRGPAGTIRDLCRIVFEPGTERKAEPHHLGVREHLVLASGRAKVGPAENPVEVRPGDYITYPGDIEHVFEALEPNTSAVVVLEHR